MSRAEERSVVSAAYDAVAPVYDRQLAGDAWMRRSLWRRYAAAFRAGQHVLDAGCGTGDDAVFLAARGVRVTGVDLSAGMIAQAERKVAARGLTGRVRFAELELADLGQLPAGEFDGLISSFAALNTLTSLDRFAADAARLLRPGGRMVLHLLNGASLWETAALVRRGRWEEARTLRQQRERTFAVGDRRVTHFLPCLNDLSSTFAPYFRLRAACGLGIFRPPGRLGPVPLWALDALGGLDEWAGMHRPWIELGRFVVLDLQRSDVFLPER